MHGRQTLLRFVTPDKKNKTKLSTNAPMVARKITRQGNVQLRLRPFAQIEDLPTRNAKPGKSADAQKVGLASRPKKRQKAGPPSNLRCHQLSIKVLGCCTHCALLQAGILEPVCWKRLNGPLDNRQEVA